jgi:sulfide:quinone oxidoreductase
MAKIVVLGAGLGGCIMAYEMKAKLRPEDQLTVVNLGKSYSFVPSNPWVAVGWRSAEEVTVDLEPVMSRKGIELKPQGAQRVHPDENRIVLNDGTDLEYDFLIIATGPDLAFDEIEGLGPEANTQSICQTDHAVRRAIPSKTW